MVKKRIFAIGIIIVLVIVSIYLGINYFSEKESFSVNTILLKLNILLEGEAVNNVKIINYEETEQKFNIYFNNFEDLASLEEKEFTLEPEISKEIKVSFKDNKKEVGVYLGQLIIETSILTKKIPIILGIEDPNYAFVIIQKNIPNYDNPFPGGKLGVEIKVFSVDGTVSPNVVAKYSIKNFDNEVVWSDEESLTLGESWSKIIDIPKTFPIGDYVFITSIDYKGIKSVAGYLFSVSEKEKGGIFGGLELFVVIIFIFIIGILILFFYFLKTRDDLLIQLRKQQNKELKENLEFIRSYKLGIRRLNHPKKKIKELRKIKKKVIKEIKFKQKKQRKELKKLKKQGKKDEMKRKLGLWKREGFRMFETKNEMKKISKKGINKKIEDWKKSGYNLDFLNK